MENVACLGTRSMATAIKRRSAITQGTSEKIIKGQTGSDDEGLVSQETETYTTSQADILR